MASSMGVIDYTDEDFNRDERLQAIGCVGEHSETTWLFRLKRELDQDRASMARTTIPPKQDDSVASVSYLTDSWEFVIPEDGDPSERPPQAIADYLVDVYFHMVHPCFPVVGRTVFVNQYRSYYSSPAARPGKRWLAILNLMFAIASRHSELIQGHVDHMMYFSRAWRLAMGDAALVDHPDLQQVQVEGLVSFYLLSVGQINRCVPACIWVNHLTRQFLADMWHVNPVGSSNGLESAKREQQHPILVERDTIPSLVGAVRAGRLAMRDERPLSNTKG